MKKYRELKGKGEFDYDYHNDNLFFKVRDRVYDRSVEFNNMVVDIDTDNFVTGIQIFHASEYFELSKQLIKSLFAWKFRAKMRRINAKKSMIEVRIIFKTKFRNKILQPTPIITESINESLPNSQISCTPVKCAIN